MGGGLGFALPRLTPVVKYLLIANVVIFLLTVFGGGLHSFLLYHFSMAAFGAPEATSGGVLSGHIWRLVTYQYLHDTSSPWHLFFNMLGLYFLGTRLEQRWGPKTFFWFYTVCGIMGGLLFTVLVAIGFLPDGRMIGASGSVLGLLGGCAVLMPDFVIILLFFPVPIRFATVLFVGIYVLSLLSAFATGSPGAGGDAAHLGGLAFGVAWCIWGWEWLGQLREKKQRGAWERRLRHEQELNQEVDRILAKVHDNGIQSLTRREKQILSEATEAQQNRENRGKRL